ncbi:hypothetical protein [Kordia jejudonensis]|uniref:hypothetical protein n=1 Tax=Kordia jejudonensis TaxID=1348245 RepID=UPI00062907A1|nr:hypothetical protein [Kordia jejudonensis]
MGNSYRLLMFAVSLLLLTQVQAQNLADNETLENIVKIQCTSMCTNGNGLIVGIDASHMYIVTAAHVVDRAHIEDSDSDTAPKFQLNFKKRLIAINPKITNAFITEDFEVIKEYASIDLAILKVKHTLPKRFYDKKAKIVGIYDVAIKGTVPSFYLNNAVEVVIQGYPAAATISLEAFKNTIHTIDFFDDTRFFKISPNRITSGHSGAPVYVDGYFSGILLTESDEFAKVLQLQEILKKLKEDNINHNLLSFPTIIQHTWRIEKVELLATNTREKKEFIEQEQLLLSFDPTGKMTGFLNANFTITPKGIRMTDIGPNGKSYYQEIPSTVNPGWFTIENILGGNYLELEFAYSMEPFAFNFSSEPLPEAPKPLEKIILKTPNAKLFLIEVRE